MIDARGLAFLLLDAIFLAVMVLRPMSRNYDESDQGAGSLVVMTMPLKPSYYRCTVFIGISFIVAFLMIGVADPRLADVYHYLVEQLLLAVIPEPALVDNFAGTLIPVFPLSILAFGFAFAIAFRASLGRRIIIILNVLLFFAVSAVADTFFGVFVLETHIPLGPVPVVSLLIQYCIAGVVVIRLLFTTCQLPRKTQLPMRRKGDLRNDAILIVCLVASIFVVMAGAAYLGNRYASNDPLVAAAIAFACPTYLFLFLNVLLGIIRFLGHQRSHPSDARPPLEVITPAYNEEILIGSLLASIDAAAGRYGGPVHSILCDDGSTDATREIATEMMNNFQYATGEIIAGRHGGKSAALNSALSVCKSEFIYRVDADCIVHEDAFHYSIPHFVEDPQVGMLGAFTLPREPYTTWIDRMRLFEMIVGFGFARPANDVVDGISCVPGTFTAFRREPALEAGGFVEGMYGEDLDLTCAIARLGYRIIIDTRVRSYEDVPNTQRQLRVQRVRWNRGATMCFARYVPFETGFAGPRYWFYTTRSTVKRMLVPLHISALAYIVSLGVLHPSPRTNILRAVSILIFEAAPGLTQLIACSVYYHKARSLIWIPLRYPFILLKHFYSLESLLGLNARPVITPRIAEAFTFRRRRAPMEPAEA